MRNLALDYGALPDVSLPAAARRAMWTRCAISSARTISGCSGSHGASSRTAPKPRTCCNRATPKRSPQSAAFEGRSSLTTWLTRITINEALARKRVQERRRKHLEAEGVQVLETYREQLAKGSHAPSPEAEAARQQLRSILECAIADLPENFRTVFVLHEIEGVSVEETAASARNPDGHGENAVDAGTSKAAAGARAGSADRAHRNVPLRRRRLRAADREGRARRSWTSRT